MSNGAKSVSPLVRNRGFDVRSGAAAQYVPLIAYLLKPAAAAGYAMAAWRLAADLSWLDDFFISSGLLSRWQVWLAIAIAAQAGAHRMNRSIHPGDSVSS